MKLLLFCLIAVLVGGSAYAYKRNPDACAKLGADLKADWPKIENDVTSIFKGAADPASHTSDGDGALPDRIPALQPSFTETTDYNQALSEAKRTGRPMILHFTGSDWCPNCKAFDQEVGSTDSYGLFARSNFITVTLDVPHQVTASTSELQGTSAVALAYKYRPQGFPTLVVVNSSERELGRVTGYNPGTGAQSVIEQLEPFAN
jgi:thioredoxin-related protein